MKSFFLDIGIVYCKKDSPVGFAFISGIGAAIVLTFTPIIHATEEFMFIIFPSTFVTLAS